MDAEEQLEFFNSISGVLAIELSIPPEPIGQLANERARPEAEIISLKLTTYVYDDVEDDDCEERPLTEAELNSIAFPEPRIKLRGEGGRTVEHTAPNGQHFTVRELLAAVEKTEFETRGDSEWFGGVDVHHIYFEGIYPSDDEEGAWDIYWGS